MPSKSMHKSFEERRKSETSAISLHSLILCRFSNYRDHREAVQQYEGIVAACLAYAFRMVTESGGEVVRSDITFVPRKIEVQPSIEDVALTTHQGAPMKAWSAGQIASWLSAVVSGIQSTEIETIVKMAESAIQISDSQMATNKRTYPSTVGLPFGTTTIAGRRKKEQIQKSGDVKKTVGQGLIMLYRTDFKIGSKNANISGATKAALQDSIRKRLDYDTLTVRINSSTTAVDSLTS